MNEHWYDSHKIIFISYPKGSGGFALRYLLGLSPDTDVISVPACDTRHDGAAHHMLDRNNMKFEFTADRLRFGPLLGEIGLSFYNIFDQTSWNMISSHIRARLSAVVSTNGVHMHHMVASKSVIITDHLPSGLVRKIFHNAKCIGLYKPLYVSMKDFYIKNLLQPISFDTATVPQNLDVLNTFEARLAMSGKSTSISDRKEHLRKELRDLCIEQRVITTDSYKVSIDDIFSNPRWKEIYTQLVDYCGLRPNIADADRFIIDYKSKQFNRAS